MCERESERESKFEGCKSCALVLELAGRLRRWCRTLRAWPYGALVLSSVAIDGVVYSHAGYGAHDEDGVVGLVDH